MIKAISKVNIRDVYGDINYDAKCNVNLYKRINWRKLHRRKYSYVYPTVEREHGQKNKNKTCEIHGVANVVYYLYDAARKKMKYVDTLWTDSRQCSLSNLYKTAPRTTC